MRMHLHVTRRCEHLSADTPTVSDLDLDVQDAVEDCRRSGVIVDLSTVVLTAQWCYATEFRCEAEVDVSDYDFAHGLERGDQTPLGPCFTLEEREARKTIIRVERRFTDEETRSLPYNPGIDSGAESFRLSITAIETHNTNGFDAGSLVGVMRDSSLRVLRNLVLARFNEPETAVGWDVCDADDIWQCSGVRISRKVPGNATALELSRLIEQGSFILRYTPQAVSGLSISFDAC